MLCHMKNSSSWFWISNRWRSKRSVNFLWYENIWIEFKSISHRFQWFPFEFSGELEIFVFYFDYSILKTLNIWLFNFLIYLQFVLNWDSHFVEIHKSSLLDRMEARGVMKNLPTLLSSGRLSLSILASQTESYNEGIDMILKVWQW